MGRIKPGLLEFLVDETVSWGICVTDGVIAPYTATSHTGDVNDAYSKKKLAKPCPF